MLQFWLRCQRHIRLPNQEPGPEFEGPLSTKTLIGHFRGLWEQIPLVQSKYSAVPGAPRRFNVTTFRIPSAFGPRHFTMIFSWCQQEVSQPKYEENSDRTGYLLLQTGAATELIIWHFHPCLFTQLAWEAPWCDVQCLDGMLNRDTQTRYLQFLIPDPYMRSSHVLIVLLGAIHSVLPFFCSRIVFNTPSATRTPSKPAGIPQ